MLHENLFEIVLIEPAVSGGADTLYIVSGYATAAMAYRHLPEIPENCLVKLIIGMCSQQGISRGNHIQFKRLASEDFPGRFECRYFTQQPPVHTKAYAWFFNNSGFKGFTGSANYSQSAFLNQGEALACDDPEEIRDYFNTLVPAAVDCLAGDVENRIKIYDERTYRTQRQAVVEAEKSREEQQIVETATALAGFIPVKISLLDRSGSLPMRSGLNWGQRPEYSREPNQAYIRVPMNIARSGFFPPKGQHFTLLTDDNEAFNCVRAQAGGKAIETPQNNSLLGKYFRRRLGVRLGSPVTIDDLKRYGRTDVQIYKIDEETYYLDFSVL